MDKITLLLNDEPVELTADEKQNGLLEMSADDFDSLMNESL